VHDNNLPMTLSVLKITVATECIYCHINSVIKSLVTSFFCDRINFFCVCVNFSVVIS
jgi:hypothetical protein